MVVACAHTPSDLTFSSYQAMEINQATRMDMLQAQEDEDEEKFEKSFELLQQVCQVFFLLLQHFERLSNV